MVVVVRDIYRRIKGRKDLVKILHGTSWMLLERIVFAIVTIFINIPLARYLGPENFGNFNYVISLGLVVASFTTLGLNHIVTTELVERPRDHAKILGTVGALRVIGAVIGLIVAYIWMTATSSTGGELEIFILLVVAAGITGSLGFLQFWFVAVHRSDVFAKASIINTIFFAILRLLQVITKTSVEWIFVAAALEIACSGCILMVAYKVVTYKSGGEDWKFSLAEAKKILPRSLILMLSGITAIIYLKIDIVLLVNLSSAAEAGIYASAARLSEAWYFLPNIVMTAALPILVRTRSVSMVQYEQRLQNLLDFGSAVAFVVAAVVTLFSTEICVAFFGEEYRSAGAILSIHIWSGIFIFMRAVLSKWFIIENLYAFSLITQLCGALANVLLNIWLIPIYGGIGSAVATLVSYATASYFALFISSATRPFGWKMTKAIFWPRRIFLILRTGEDN